MKPFTSDLESVLAGRLQFIAMENHRNIIMAENSLKESLSALRKLKAFILKYRFRSESEEIDFFKNIKPQFLSRVIYFNKIYKIETRRPSGGEKSVRNYFRTEFRKLKRYFNNNSDFYGYYRAQHTFMDHLYFLRGKIDVKLNVDTFVFEADPKFCTSHDYTVARIIANDMLEVYLNDEVEKLKRQDPEEQKIYIPKVKLNWTDNKSAMIELIYALYYKGSLNNGQADIKEITKYFETVFNIDLGDVYRSYIEIKNRSSRTKFLTNLQDLLNDKMAESDE